MGRNEEGCPAVPTEGRFLDIAHNSFGYISVPRQLLAAREAVHCILECNGMYTFHPKIKKEENGYWDVK